jgi:hypothetical protein
MNAPEREQFLQRLALFSDLEAGELRALAAVAQAVQFPASALIFREGEAGDCAYAHLPGRRSRRLRLRCRPGFGASLRHRPER